MEGRAADSRYQLERPAAAGHTDHINQETTTMKTTQGTTAMKTAWIIVDLSTGSIDGLYHDYAFAKGAFERIVRRGAKNLALCEVEEMAGRGKLEDGAFWRTNGRGFDGVPS